MSTFRTDKSLINIFCLVTGCLTEKEIKDYFTKHNVCRKGTKTKDFENTDYELFFSGTHSISFMICNTKENTMAELMSFAD